MKIIDPEHWIFTLTSLAIAVVFVLLTPSAQIIADWFPGKTDWLWLYPGGLFALSLLLWFVYRLSLPRLIEKGIMDDRRKNREPLQMSISEQVWHWFRPMLRLMAQVFLIAALCSSALTLMRSGQYRALLTKVAEDPLFDARAVRHKW